MSDAKYTAARRKMAAFVMARTGAKLDSDPIVHDGKIALTGEQVECEKVRAHMTEMGVDGIVVDELDPELGTWTVVRIPLEALEQRLANLTR